MAAETARGLLHRTGGAFKAMTDDRVRQSVNHAQVEQGRQAREEFERTSELAPVIRHFEQTADSTTWSGPATPSWPPRTG